MVREANVKQAAAEKQLKEAQGKVCFSFSLFSVFSFPFFSMIILSFFLSHHVVPFDHEYKHIRNLKDMPFTHMEGILSILITPLTFLLSLSRLMSSKLR